MKAIWDPMQKLMQMENNAKEYRRQLNEGAGQPRVPHLGNSLLLSSLLAFLLALSPFLTLFLPISLFQMQENHQTCH